MELDEKTWGLVQDARFLNLSESIIFPLLDTMIQERQDLMVSKFTGGEKDLLAEVAGIAALKDLKTRLKSMQLKGNRAAAKITEKD